MSIAEFEKEPLTEVVFGVEFNALEFSSVHFGLYWQTICHRYPSKPIDRPPIGEIELFSILPKLRRIWFESEDRKQLIQVQPNRFHYNWRRQSHKEKYPHYAEIYPKFIEEWNHFQAWWTATDELPLQPIRYELTYINKMDEYFGWNSAKDYPKIFSIIDQHWHDLPLPPNSLNLNLGLNLANNQGTLTVAIDQGINPKDNKAAVFLNLTASHDDTSIDIEQWFETAHQSIVEVFLSLVKSDIQKDWGIQWLQR
jgi:uncharacterized protein (TIGR04255 family)